MANVLDIRRRIRSVRSTRQITKAMQMVSAARLRRAQERALSARPYSQMLVNVLRSLVSRTEIYDPKTGEPRHPLLIRREEKTVLGIVISGEKGFAGAFNANIFKGVDRYIESHPEKNIDLLLIGRKAREYFRRRYPYAPGMHGEGEAPAAEQERAGRVQITGEHMNVLGKNDVELAREVGWYAIDRYMAKEIDAVYLVYNEFKSVIAQRVIVDEILPIKEIGEHDIQQADEMSLEDRKRAIEAAKTAGVSPRHPDTSAVDAAAAEFGSRVDYIYEQPPTELLSAMLPRYVGVMLYRAMLESVAAEHAARMTAMDSATNNASEMIDSLTLTMNRVRQAMITKEIIEIVSGAAAL